MRRRSCQWCLGLLSLEGASYPHHMNNPGFCGFLPGPTCVTGFCITRWGKPCCGRSRCTGAEGDGTNAIVGRCVPDETCLAAGAGCGGGDGEAGRPCCRPLECAIPVGAAPGARGECAERACVSTGEACGTSNDIKCCAPGLCVVPSNTPPGAPGACVAEVPGCTALGAACSAGAFEGACCNGAVCSAGGEGKPGVCVVG